MLKNVAMRHVSMLVCAIALSCTGALAGSGAARKPWAKFVNSRWSFCVEYPPTWKAVALTDGSGVNLYPFPKKDPNNATNIEISALPNQPRDMDNPLIVYDDSPPLTLQENFNLAVRSLREYDHASDTRVLRKREVTFHGYPALDTTVQYIAPPNEAHWVQKTLWVNKDDAVIFTASLVGSPAQVRDLDPIFKEIVHHRFRLVCGPRQ